MAITTSTDIFNPEVLTEAIQGVFAQKNALMGSLLTATGAAIQSGDFPEGGPAAIGKEVTVPFFGVIGDFENNPDGSSATPKKLLQTSEKATTTRDSLAVEVSMFARGVGQSVDIGTDPLMEAARQIEVAATRAMDKRLITAAGGSLLVNDVHSATAPVTMSYDLVVDSQSLWHDEVDDIVAMVVHHRTWNDMLKLKDATGRPLLIRSQDEGKFDRFNGIPVGMSDRVPLTGSTMGAVTATGTSPPTITLTGEPLGPWNLVIDIVVGGADGTATYRFSVDGGNTFSVTKTTPVGGGTVALNDVDDAGDDTPDSLVGINGKTGISAVFPAGTFNADNQYTASAQLKVTSFVLKRQALAFWWNRAALEAKMDVDVLADTDIVASHLYAAGHLYRRTFTGTKPGVVRILHNVTGF